MKKHSLLIMKCAVGLIILFGVLLILFTNDIVFRKILNDDVENISKLSASTLYGEINSGLTQPIFVGQTMANDLFLKNWLSEEVPEGNDPAQIQMMQSYLSNYSKKYGYDSVSLISAGSGVYYYQDGINKVVNEEDAHDVWYYDFIRSDQHYKLNVDTDEANSNTLTVFVDSKVLANDGTLLGVVGVGIKMSHLQKLFQAYETDYALKALLINDQGLVQVDSIAENIETANFFDNPEMLALKDQILQNKTGMQMFWYPAGGSDHCLITEYVDNLDWYLVIEKNTALVQQQLTSQFHQDLLLASMIIFLVLLMISYIIGSYNRILLKTASMDEVTNLPNLKMFQEIFSRNTRRPDCRHGALFLFDIDHFKQVNDRRGHLYGNTVLYRISEKAKNIIGSKGVAARFGGDEFVGVIYGTRDEAEKILQQLVEGICADEEGVLDGITISLGAAEITGTRDLDLLLKEADAAMYRSKEKGRNQITFSE